MFRTEADHAGPKCGREGDMDDVSTDTLSFGRQFEAIVAQLERGEIPTPVTVRTLLSWFGAKRRGYYIVQNIRGHLHHAGLQTDPDFEPAYIDSEVRFVRESPDAPEDVAFRVLQAMGSDTVPREPRSVA